MGRSNNKLSVNYCKKPDLEPGLYGDGAGLYLQVSPRVAEPDEPKITKAWVFRFMIAGRARKMGLGDFDRVSLADARKKAQAAHLLVVDGIDPIDVRASRKASEAADRAKLMTFKEAAEKYIAAHEAGWKSKKHAGQWRATLETYAYPTIGHLSVAAADSGLVLEILEPIWSTKTETASRVRGRVESILDWAKARGLRQGENPARWRGHLDQLLPSKSSVAPVRHHPALPYDQIPAFMAALRKKDSISARALEYTILTAARTSDTTDGVVGEVDVDERKWTIPASRLKGRKGTERRDHVIPLSDRALAVLAAVPREGEYLFPGGNEGEPLSSAAMSEMLKGMGYAPELATVHGMRSSFKDWCSEQTAYPNELSEMALAHTVPDKVEAAYRRGDMREKRRRLMADWAAYCESPVQSKAGNVVAMRGAK